MGNTEILMLRGFDIDTQIDNGGKGNYLIVSLSESKRTYLSPPLSGLRSTLNSLNQGKTMYLMYSRHGFPSAIFGGQYAFFILRFTSACDNQY